MLLPLCQVVINCLTQVNITVAGGAVYIINAGFFSWRVVDKLQFSRGGRDTAARPVTDRQGFTRV